MSDFAELVMAVDARDMERGNRALDAIVRKASTAEASVGKSLFGIGRSATGMAGTVARAVASAAGALTGLVAAYVSFAAVKSAVTVAKDFNAAIAETSTLIEGTPAQLRDIADAATALSKAYGKSSTEEVKGFYQALSSGVSGIAAATVLVDEANKLAVGGVTDVFTAVDILTTATNVYTKEGLKAADASDALFVAMRAGKTTIPELASNLGKALPLAQQLGITFDEVAATTAALTKGGIATAESITSLRAAMTAVLKPSKEATDTAKALGIDFSSAGLKAKGFAGFMADVVAKTGGSAEAMAALFSSVEATTVALAMSGAAGGFAAEIMAQMADKTGQAQAAYDKMAGSLSGRLDLALADLNVMMLNLGTAILPLVVSAAEMVVAAIHGIGGAFSFLVAHADTVGQILLILAATRIPVLIVTLVAAASGFSIAAFAAGAFATASAFAAGALALLGGPVGILAMAAAAAVLFAIDIGKPQQPSYDTAAAMAAIEGEMRTFYTTHAPSAGKAAVALANDYYKLAAAAVEAAKAQLAASQTALNNPIGAAEYDVMGNYTGYDMQAETEAAYEAQAALDKANASLDAMIAKSKQVVTAVTGSDFSAITVATAKAVSQSVEVVTTGIGDLGAAAGGAVEEVKDLNETVLDFAKTMRGEVSSSVDSVADAIGNWAASGFKNAKGMMDSILSTFRSFIAKMIATAIANPIKIALGLGSAPAAAAAGVAGAAAPATGILSTIGGIGATIGKGLFAGVSGLFGTGSGIAGSLGFISSSLAAAGTGLGAFATAIGAVAAPLLAVVAIFSFFRTKTTELDAGLKLTVNGMDTLVDTFRTVQTSRFWGLFKSTNTYTDAASKEVAGPIQRAVADIQTTILKSAAVLGIADTAFKDFAYSMSVSTAGLSQEDAARAVQDALIGLGDAFAGLAPGLTDLAKDGEGAMQTLERLSTSLTTLKQLADTLGLRFEAVGLAGAAMASELVDAFGGMDALRSATDTYYAAFYTDQERLATATRQASEAIAELGLTMPKSRDQYRAMIEAIDLTTESGRNLFAALVSMSGVMDYILPQVASFTAGIASLVGAAMTGMDAMIADVDAAQSDALSAASAWYDTAKTLRSFVSDLRGAASSLISPAQAQAYNAARYQVLLAEAMAGNMQSAKDITGVASSLIESTNDSASSSFEAARQQAVIMSDLSLLAGVSELAGAGQDVVASLLREQGDILKQVRDYLAGGGSLDAATVDSLNAQIGSLQDAIEAAKLITYANLKSRIDVTVDLLATASIPAPLRALLANAATGITADLDFIVRAEGITPAVRFLALNATSEHLTTVEFLAKNPNFPPRLADLALKTASATARTVNFVIGTQLSDEDKILALTTTSELMRTINVTLASGYSPQAMSLALAASSGLLRTINAVLKPGRAGTPAMRLALATASSLTRTVLATLGSGGSNAAVTLALATTSNLVRHVTASLGTATESAALALALAHSSALTRKIDALVAAGADQQAIDLALAEGSKLTRVVTAALAAGASPRAIAIALAKDKTLRRTFRAILDKSRLGQTDIAFLNAITGSTAGTITLGGSFQFDPTSSFQAWYEQATQDGVAAPLDTLSTKIVALRGTLSTLAAAIRANTQQQVDAANLAAAQAKLAGLITARAGAVSSLQSAVGNVQAFDVATAGNLGLNGAAAVLGVNASGTLDYQADAVYGAGAAIRQWKQNFWNTGGLEDTMLAANRAVLLADRQLAAARASIIALGGVPAFANGGMHRGGLRMVGDGGGPEIEATGPARLYSASQTRGLILGGNTDMQREMRALREEVEKLSAQHRQIDGKIMVDLRRLRQLEEQWEKTGMPPARAVL